MDSRIMDVRLATAAQWFRDQAASGLSKREWCKQNGISRNRFFYFQRQLQEKALGQNPGIEQAAANALAPAFVEVPTPACMTGTSELQQKCHPDHTSADEKIQISYGDFHICISDEVSEQALTKVLRAVKHAD